MDFSFLHPQYLLLLLLIPIVFLIHFFSLGSRKKKALRFANFDAIARIEGVDFFSKNIVILLLNVLVAVLLIFSLSGFTFHTLKESSSFSFVLAIDSSQSMEATDFPPDRMTIAKKIASEFIDSAPVDVKMGVISFSSSSRIEKELTNRRDELKKAINEIALSGLGGTDLYEAILTSTNLFSSGSAKAVVLLSDGQINVGSVDEAIKYANDNNVIIHTIGMGTLEGGKTEYAFSKLDEDSLKSIAYNTKGSYFRADNAQNLSSSFNDIFKLTKRKVAINLSDYMLIIAIVLIVVEFFLTNTRYVNFP